MKPINISIDGEFKQAGEQHSKIECDDAIIIFSSINGVVMGISKNGDPAYTRDVSAWVGGFDSMPDAYTRLSQGLVQLFMNSESKRINQFNLINLIQFLIANGGLLDQVRLSLSEEFINGKEKQ